jgi:hypothetical protein
MISLYSFLFSDVYEICGVWDSIFKRFLIYFLITPIDYIIISCLNFSVNIAFNLLLCSPEFNALNTYAILHSLHKKLLFYAIFTISVIYHLYLLLFQSSISRPGGTAGWLWKFRLDNVGRWHDSELPSLGGQLDHNDPGLQLEEFASRFQCKKTDSEAAGHHKTTGPILRTCSAE